MDFWDPDIYHTIYTALGVVDLDELWLLPGQPAPAIVPPIASLLRAVRARVRHRQSRQQGIIASSSAGLSAIFRSEPGAQSGGCALAAAAFAVGAAPLATASSTRKAPIRDPAEAQRMRAAAIARAKAAAIAARASARASRATVQ